MWYLSPLACLYDLLQLGLGHRNGFNNGGEVPGQESVAPATAALEGRTGVEAPMLGTVCGLLSGAGEAGTDEIGLCALESGWA